MIDAIEGNRIYIPAIYVINKIDAISIEELDLLVIEALTEPNGSSKYNRADDAIGRIALLLQDLSEAKSRCSETSVRVAVYAMSRREEPGEQAAMSRQGQGDWREGVFKEETFLGQGIDIRRGLMFITVTTQVVCARRIQTDQDNCLRPRDASLRQGSGRNQKVAAKHERNG